MKGCQQTIATFVCVYSVGTSSSVLLIVSQLELKKQEQRWEDFVGRMVTGHGGSSVLIVVPATAESASTGEQEKVPKFRKIETGEDVEAYFGAFRSPWTVVM